MKIAPLLSIDKSKPDEVIFAFDIRPELDAFHGHFPGHPILPGVVQIDWVMQLAVLHLGITQPAADKFQVKFRKIIGPNMPLSLGLKLDRTRGSLSFTYMSGEDIMASGQVKIAATT